MKLTPVKANPFAQEPDVQEPRLTAVGFDPFAEGPEQATLTPVDSDPFAEPERPRTRLEEQGIPKMPPLSLEGTGPIPDTGRPPLREDRPDFMSEIGAAWRTGVQRTKQMAGAGLELGLRRMREAEEKAIPPLQMPYSPEQEYASGIEWAEGVQARAREAIGDLPQPPELGGDWWENLKDPETSGAQLAWMLGSNIQPTLAIGASALLAGVAAGPTGALATGTLGAHLLESGASFDELKDAGVPEDEAASTAAIVGTVNAILEMAPIARLGAKIPIVRKLLGGAIKDELVAKPMLRRAATEMIKQGALEGGTEALQEIVQNAGKRVYDENQDLLEGIGEAAFVGGLIGALFGGVGGALPQPTQTDQLGGPAADILGPTEFDVPAEEVARQSLQPQEGMTLPRISATLKGGEAAKVGQPQSMIEIVQAKLQERGVSPAAGPETTPLPPQPIVPRGDMAPVSTPGIQVEPADRFSQPEQPPVAEEELELAGPAPERGEAFTETEMLPGEVMKGATNELRRTPEQMMELTKQIQAEGVKPGSVVMRRTPAGKLELVEGHHTSTVADALAADKPIPVRILEAPAAETPQAKVPGLSKGLTDERIRRDEYRTGLERLASDLTEGGGTVVLPPTPDRPYGARTPSVNPSWAQELMDADGIGVKQIKNAVRKALAGQPLGARQARVIESMLDQAAVELAADRQAVLDARRPLPVSQEDMERLYADFPEFREDMDGLGSLQEDESYPQDWDQQARSLEDLASLAAETGATDSQIEGILELGVDDSAVAVRMLNLIEDTRRGRESEGRSEVASGAPREAVAPAQEVTPEREEPVPVAPAAAPEPLVLTPEATTDLATKARQERERARPAAPPIEDLPLFATEDEKAQVDIEDLPKVKRQSAVAQREEMRLETEKVPEDDTGPAPEPKNAGQARQQVAWVGQRLPALERLAGERYPQVEGVTDEERQVAAKRAKVLREEDKSLRELMRYYESVDKEAAEKPAPKPVPAAEAQPADKEQTPQFSRHGSPAPSTKGSTVSQLATWIRPITLTWADGLHDATSLEDVADSALADTKRTLNLGDAMPIGKEGDRGIPVPRQRPTALPKRDAGVFDVLPDSAWVTSKLFGDSNTAQAIRDHGFQQLNIKKQKLVFSRVRTAIHDPKVLNAIVDYIPVEMMDYLGAGKLPASVLLHDPSMLQGSFPVDFDSPIIAGFVDTLAAALPSMEAAGRTETERRSLDVRKPAAKRGTTKGTIDDRHGLTPASEPRKRVAGVQPPVTPPNISRPAIKPVQQFTDLPKAIQDAAGGPVDGVYDPDTHTIYLVADMIPTPQAAKRTLAHESIGHASMEQIVPNWTDVVETVQGLEGTDKRVGQLAREVDERYGTLPPTDRVKEILAIAAEKQVKAGPLAQLLAKVRAAIRRWLKAHGLSRVWENAEIDLLLDTAQRNLYRGKYAGGQEMAGAPLGQPLFSRLDPSKKLDLSKVPAKYRKAASAAEMEEKAKAPTPKGTPKPPAEPPKPPDGPSAGTIVPDNPITILKKKTADEPGILNIFKSPNEVAKKYPVFRPYFKAGEKAARTQERLRKMFRVRLKAVDKALKSQGQYKANKDLLTAIRIEGDMTETDYTPDQLKSRFNAPENVIDAYRLIRSAYDHALAMANRNRELRGKVPVNRRTGYVPHFFHSYFIRDEGGIITSAKTLNEALKLARAAADGGAKNVLVVPKTFKFPGGDIQAAVLGDRSFFSLRNKMEKRFELTPEDVATLVRMKGRSRFVGNFMQRKGAPGWEKELEWVDAHYFNMMSRYTALDPFKRETISRFEQGFGDFEKSHKGLAGYTKRYIGDINGNPTVFEELLNRSIERSPVGKFLGSYLGDRPSLQLAGMTTNAVAIAKLGLLNASAAVVNATQFMAVNARLNEKWTSIGMARAVRVFAIRGGRIVGLNPGADADIGILKKAGVEVQLGVESGAGYSKVGQLGPIFKSSMVFFQGMEVLLRSTAVLGGYHKALSQGKSRAEALAYAEEVNRSSNFNYGIEDSPELLRQSGPLGQVLLQFKKFPIKMTEFVMDLKGMEHARFWIPWALMSGYFALPGFEPIKELIRSVFGIDIELELKDFLMKWADDDDEDAQKAKQAVAKTIMYGAMGNEELGGVDLSHRIGMGDFIPSRASDMWGPAFSSVIRAGQLAGRDEWAESLRAISSPLGNYLIALTGEGDITSPWERGRLVVQLEGKDRVLKALGFRTTQEALATDIKRVSGYKESMRRKRDIELIDDYLAADMDGDKALSDEAWEKLTERGIRNDRVRDERNRKEMARIDRAMANIPKSQKADLDYLRRFAEPGAP